MLIFRVRTLYENVTGGFDAMFPFDFLEAFHFCDTSLQLEKLMTLLELLLKFRICAEHRAGLNWDGIT